MTQPAKHTNHTETETTVTVHSPYHTNWDKPFWRGVVSSDQGVGSTSRVSALAVVVVSLSVVIYLVVLNREIPNHILQLGWFSALLITAIYSPAKLAGIFKSWASRK